MYVRFVACVVILMNKQTIRHILMVSCMRLTRPSGTRSKKCVRTVGAQGPGPKIEVAIKKSKKTKRWTKKRIRIKTRRRRKVVREAVPVIARRTGIATETVIGIGGAT